MSLADAWEEHAAEWIAWAREPDHDGFWSGTWPELVAVLPGPDGLTVEFGCGEGRASRHLMAAGHTVVSVELSPTLARGARTGDPPVAVAQADATAVPFPDECADLVVACMVLQDVDDLSGTASEVARVLRAGGHLCFAIVHPFSSAADADSLGSGGKVTVTAPYLTEHHLRGPGGACRHDRGGGPQGVPGTLETGHG